MTGRDDDDAWRAIVDNYGDRPALPDPEPAPAPGASEEPEPFHPTYDEEGFVPPEPPPLPQVAGDRLAAWAGVLGVPVLLVVLLLAGVHVGSWLALLLVAGFVGGFGYLVARMPREPRDPWDDGSRL